MRRDSFDSDFYQIDSDEERFKALKISGNKNVKPEEIDSEEERNLVRNEKKEKKTKNVKFDSVPGAKHKAKAFRKQIDEEFVKAEKLDVAEERRKSNRL